MSRAVTVASKQQKRILQNMANDFRRLDCIVPLGTENSDGLGSNLKTTTSTVASQC